MVGPLSQLIHLVAAFRAAKAGVLPADFFPAHGEFKFCNSVSFLQGRQTLFGRKAKRSVASNPREWLLHLVKTGTSEAFLRHWDSRNPQTPDHALVGFVGGGGPWAFVGLNGSDSHLWFGEWVVTRPNAPDDRIWSVTYTATTEHGPWPALTPDLEALSAQLHQALLEVEEFSFEHGLKAWVPWFVRGREVLEEEDPSFPDYVDTSLLPHYPPPARRLLAACYAAWVFGGMGSWNDCGFSEPDVQSDYEARSRSLYAAINSAIQGATAGAA